MAFCEGLARPQDIQKMVQTLAPMPVSFIGATARERSSITSS